MLKHSFHWEIEKHSKRNSTLPFVPKFLVFKIDLLFFNQKKPVFLDGMLKKDSIILDFVLFIFLLNFLLLNIA